MASSPALGAHVDQTDPIAEATARQAPLVQFFLGDPQSYKGPEIRYADGPFTLEAAAAWRTRGGRPESDTKRPNSPL